jgi:hypothetical protein
VDLPADYVAEHVELAYASSAHRAQGRTVDTAHAMQSLRQPHERCSTSRPPGGARATGSMWTPTTTPIP